MHWSREPASCSSALGEAGVPLALVTSSCAWWPTAVLDAICPGAPSAPCTGDEVRRGKPHPDPYLLAARALGVDPATGASALEDSADRRRLRPRAAGRYTVAVPSLAAVPAGSAHHQVASLEELDPPRWPRVGART